MTPTAHSATEAGNETATADDGDDPAPGSWVQDRDSEDSGRALVVETFDITAAEWGIPSLQKTVAEANPDYPGDDPVVRVVFEDDIDRKHPEMDAVDLVSRDIQANGRLEDTALMCYTYPATRLQVAEAAEADAE